MAIFNKDLIELTAKNTYFQREVYRDKNIQIVLMSIAPGDDIGEETHRADQTTFFVSGTGQAVVDGSRSKVGPNRLIVIPQGARHNIINKGQEPLQLYSVYAPPAEPKGVAYRTKEAAEEGEKSIVTRAAEKVAKAVTGGRGKRSPEKKAK